MANFKRKRKLINKGLQLKLVAVFTAIGCICALFQIILLNFGLLEIARSVPSGGEDVLRQARGMMVTNTLWTLGAMIPLMTCIGVVVTHRVAGPAYRMTQHCKEIAAGEPVRPCKIRKDDELQELCDALNAAIARLAPAEEASEDYVDEWLLESTPSLVREAQERAATSPDVEHSPEEPSAKN